MGPCAKQVVNCAIIAPSLFDNSMVVLAEGTNACKNPQDVCPRAPGEDYTKCKTVCDQQGHAELQALAEFNQVSDAYIGRILKRYVERGGVRAVITGHTYACRECQEALYAAGVKWISVEHNMRESK